MAVTWVTAVYALAAISTGSSHFSYEAVYTTIVYVHICAFRLVDAHLFGELVPNSITRTSAGCTTLVSYLWACSNMGLSYYS